MVIASTTNFVTKDGANCALGNFCCDALYFGAKNFYKNDSIDIVILNRGGLRINLPKGDIKIGTIFELMPFENELALVTITGDKLLEVLPALADKPHPFLGMKVEINAKKEVTATINNLPINKTKNYNIITSDYLANGVTAQPRQNLLILQSISADSLGRWIARSLVSFSSGLPYLF